jgi:solute carrier family 9B (sodium/hydrogen exchanger), member 1/2
MPFNLFIVLFFVGGWGAGKLIQKAALPPILGMVLFGLLIRFSFPSAIPDLIFELDPFLKSLALLVILLRAGLGIRKSTLVKVGRAAVPMAFIPCLMEAAVLTLAWHFLFDLPLLTSALGAFMLSAVSPAVVVPSMLDLKEQGLGAENDVPTIVLAGASVDDVVAITFFSLFLMLATSGASFSISNTGSSLLSIPLSIAGGIAGGFAVGAILASWFSRHKENIRATEKTLLLLMVAMVLVEIGNALHLAALLGVMTVGFMLLERAEAVAHELAGKLSKVWVIAEIILFVLIGMAVDIPVALEAGARGLLLICFGLAARSIGVWISTAFDPRLNRKERLFCLFAYLPKATVQAALGTVPLAAGIAGGEQLLSVAVLSIIVTAPLGLLLIRGFGPRLLG